jgi:hypothetical protein
VRDYEAHVAACPFVEVCCPFSDSRCAFRAARRDMGVHSSNMGAHSLMLMSFTAVNEAMKRRIAALEEDSSSLQRYVSIL